MDHGIVLGTWVLFTSSAAIGWIAAKERATPWRVLYFTLGIAALLLAFQGAVRVA